GIRPAGRGAGPPADQDQQHGRPGPAELGGTPGHPGRTRPGLPARVRCRRAARPGIRTAHPSDGGGEMTSLSTPAAARDTRLRPVPWRKLTWVIWRQHRIALAGVAVLLAGLAAYLVFQGLKI